MAQENVAKFEELLRSDETLQAKARAAVAAYTGDKADARAVFAAVVAPLADEAGLPFTFEESKSFAQDGKELDDAELEAVAGGSCFLVGGGYGKGDSAACYEIGVGFFDC